jgi:NADH-quinone oxidoreductase subunit M
VIFGGVANDGVAKLQDIGVRELVMLVALALAVLALGVWPAPLVEVMDESLAGLLTHAAQSKL